MTQFSLLAEAGSDTKAGGATLAQFVTAPVTDALNVPVTVNTTLPPLAI